MIIIANWLLRSPFLLVCGFYRMFSDPQFWCAFLFLHPGWSWEDEEMRDWWKCPRCKKRGYSPPMSI